MNTKKSKKTHLSEKDIERLELLQKAHEKQGMQLEYDVPTASLREIDEIKQMIGNDLENPEEKYNTYYNGIQKLLIEYLPKGEEYKEGRQLIYDEKNIFLNRGRKKSDNNGTRKSDGRMTYQPIMGEMMDLVLGWVSGTRNPVDLYNKLYDLNEKHGYGHEDYDMTSRKANKAIKALKEKK